jgi:hypothetical protein
MVKNHTKAKQHYCKCGRVAAQKANVLAESAADDVHVLQWNCC